MTLCERCGVELPSGVEALPICLQCNNPRKAASRADSQIQNALVDAVVRAIARVNRATATFNRVLSQFPSGLPDPDGAQSIHNASRELSSARKEEMIAHLRLDSFVSGGSTPQQSKPEPGERHRPASNTDPPRIQPVKEVTSGHTRSKTAKGSK